MIQLQCGALRAVADPFGAELISLRGAQNEEYLWAGDARWWAGRSPHLFPVIGALPGGVYETQGRVYAMKKHGFARDSIFETAQQTPCAVTFLLRDSAATRAVYPYSFLFCVTHALHENGFTTTYEVQNTGGTPMPFFVGGHVGFACPHLSGASFDDYALHFTSPVSARALCADTDNPLCRSNTFVLLENEAQLPLRYSLFDKGALILEQLSCSAVSLVHMPTGRGVQMDFTGFPVLALWTMPQKQAPYLCLEPWHGLPALHTDGAALPAKPYCILLAPNERTQRSYTVTLLHGTNSV